MKISGNTCENSPTTANILHIKFHLDSQSVLLTCNCQAYIAFCILPGIVDVNYQRLKHVALQLGVGMGDVLASLEPATIGQLTSGDNPYQSRRRMAWPSSFGQRHMLYSPRCHRRIPQATLGLTHASQGVLLQQMLKQHKRVSQCLPPLKRWASLRLIVNPVYRYFK